MNRFRQKLRALCLGRSKAIGNEHSDAPDADGAPLKYPPRKATLCEQSRASIVLFHLVFQVI